MTSFTRAFQRQQQFVRALLSRPEYGKLGRTWKEMLCTLSLKRITCSVEELWRAMQSVISFQRVHIGISTDSASLLAMPLSKQIPSDLFESATPVTLVRLHAIRPSEVSSQCNRSRNA